MRKRKFNEGWVELKAPVTAAKLQALANLDHIEKLSVVQDALLTVEAARGFAALASVKQLWLWCDVTRTAMRHVITIPGLQVLDVLGMRHPGRLAGFSAATMLKEFRANFCMTEADLIEVASCQSLCEIGAQNATLTSRIVEAFLDMPMLQSLDLEATNLDDAMAIKISSSTSLRSLDVGATRLTRIGLSHFCKMKQLRSLDLWATNIAEHDLDLLTQLPKLEYLSVGGYEGSASFNAETLLQRLRAIPSLERIWLDGVHLTAQQKADLEAKYKYVRIT